MTLDRTDMIMFLGWMAVLADLGFTGMELWLCTYLWLVGCWFGRAWIDRWFDSKFPDAKY